MVTHSGHGVSALFWNDGLVVPNDDNAILARVLAGASIAASTDLCDPVVELERGCAVDESPGEGRERVLDDVAASAAVGLQCGEGPRALINT